VHRVLLRTARTPLARVWAPAYRVIARVWAAFLVRGERGAAAYARGSVGADDLVPGLSDIDVAVVLSPDRGGRGVARERVTGRWTRLLRAFRPTDLLLDYPLVYEEDELREVAGATALTYGLDEPGERRAAYNGDGVSEDRIRLLERPGLYGATDDWRLLTGPDRRPPEPARDAQLRRIAAWLELLSWWRWVFSVCVDPSGPRTADLCVKLVAEPARIWLWLAHGERAGGRSDVLHRALRRMPEEAEPFRRALELRRSLPDSPEPPLAEVLPVLVRLSARIAGLIAAEVEEHGATEVRLAGPDPDELVLPQGGWRPCDALVGGREPRLLALCDWRSLACPTLPDECFAPLPGDPGDPAVLGAAAASQLASPYPALRAGGLMVFPGLRWGTQLRAVKCSVTDPVSFALADGIPVARFPNVAGWSAHDTARRAVAEHRAWLRVEPDAEGSTLAMLLTAARAGLFLDSVEDGGAPELPLTVTETARRLAARSAGAQTVAEEGLERYREFAVDRTRPPAGTLAAMRKLVLALPAYAEHPSPSP
jgi:predicted nucleotidyltransferase